MVLYEKIIISYMNFAVFTCLFECMSTREACLCWYSGTFHATANRIKRTALCAITSIFKLTSPYCY